MGEGGPDWQEPFPRRISQANSRSSGDGQSLPIILIYHACWCLHVLSISVECVSCLPRFGGTHQVSRSEKNDNDNNIVMTSVACHTTFETSSSKIKSMIHEIIVFHPKSDIFYYATNRCTTSDFFGDLHEYDSRNDKNAMKTHGDNAQACGVCCSSFLGLRCLWTLRRTGNSWWPLPHPGTARTHRGGTLRYPCAPG